MLKTFIFLKNKKYISRLKLKIYYTNLKFFTITSCPLKTPANRFVHQEFSSVKMTEGKEKMGSIMFKPCPRFHIQIDSLLKSWSFWNHDGQQKAKQGGGRAIGSLKSKADEKSIKLRPSCPWFSLLFYLISLTLYPVEGSTTSSCFWPNLSLLDCVEFVDAQRTYCSYLLQKTGFLNYLAPRAHGDLELCNVAVMVSLTIRAKHWILSVGY